MCIRDSVGSDLTDFHSAITVINFNPRSPCGERQLGTLNGDLDDTRFQSTLPVWGATVLLSPAGSTVCGISIHAPRVGSDTSAEEVRESAK